LSKLTTHQRKARDLMQRENWDGALSELQRVLGLDGSNPTLHNQIGDVCLRKGAIEQACDHFEMAIDLYSTVGLHNNPVALCRKVVRLAPTRVEVRYNLARLRMDQGLRSDATAAFVDYLEHAQPTDDAAADALEKRCVEVVESYPDLAPVGQIVERLETVKRPQGAYKIVQRAAQRATDSGDAAAAARLTEKMRSLRVAGLLRGISAFRNRRALRFATGRKCLVDISRRSASGETGAMGIRLPHRRYRAAHRPHAGRAARRP
jgi:tetratricopeptide (TPR) repeat protein